MPSQIYTTRKAQGRCASCNAPAHYPHVRCASCLEKERVWHRTHAHDGLTALQILALEVSRQGVLPPPAAISQANLIGCTRCGTFHPITQMPFVTPCCGIVLLQEVP